MAGPHDVHMRAEEEAGIKLRDRQREHQAIELHRLITAFKSFIIFLGILSTCHTVDTVQRLYARHGVSDRRLVVMYWWLSSSVTSAISFGQHQKAHDISPASPAWLCIPTHFRLNGRRVYGGESAELVNFREREDRGDINRVVWAPR